jgi:hypothetical protein
MKKCNYGKLFLVVFTFLFILTMSMDSTAFAQNKKKSKQSLTDAETAGLRLAALAQKGYISMQLVEPSYFMLVEPKVWTSMMHKDKIDLCKLGLIYTHGYRKETGKKINFLILWDMTTHATIARAYLDDNRIEILR